MGEVGNGEENVGEEKSLEAEKEKGEFNACHTTYGLRQFSIILLFYYYTPVELPVELVRPLNL